MSVWTPRFLLIEADRRSRSGLTNKLIPGITDKAESGWFQRGIAHMPLAVFMRVQPS